MKTKKPDIFLGITMGMLVLAAVLCLVILLVQSKGTEPSGSDPGQVVLGSDTQNTGETGNSGETGDVKPSDSTPPETEAPDPIDADGLKAALKDSLKGLTSEWQVAVIDPTDNTKVYATANCKSDDWMTANRMPAVFIMGTAYQQVKDGTLTRDQIKDDVTAMIAKGDLEAADRLTELVGGGDAAKGRETVKKFATDNNTQLGFNRPLSKTGDRPNYMTAKQAALILQKLSRGKLVSSKNSTRMMDALLSAGTGDIEVELPDGAKAGLVNDIEEGTCICTMGVIRLQNRDVVISVVCNLPVTTDGAKKKVAELINVTLPFFAD